MQQSAPIPPEISAARYQGQAGRQYHESKRRIPERAVPWVANLRAQKIQPYVALTDHVFEFGAGFGWNLAHLQCARRVAYDVAESTREAALKAGLEVCASLGEIAPESFDTVLCHHTLEHLLNPAEALARMHEWLRPGGKLLLFVPYERERRYRWFNPNEPNHHLYSWNAQTLGNLVEDCRFKLLEARVSQFGYDRFAANVGAQLHAGELGFRLIRTLAHALRPAFEVFIVAQKP